MAAIHPRLPGGSAPLCCRTDQDSGRLKAAIVCGHPVPSSSDLRDQAQLDLHPASAIANWRARGTERPRAQPSSQAARPSSVCSPYSTAPKPMTT